MANVRLTSCLASIFWSGSLQSHIPHTFTNYLGAHHDLISSGAKVESSASRSGTAMKGPELRS
jgi:hypothetical protein